MKQALIISCFDWYEKRIGTVFKYLNSKGYNVTILTSDYDHINKQYRKERNVNCTYVHVPSYKKNISAQRIVSHMAFGRAVGKQLEKIKPDLIYLLFPPNNTGGYCLKYIEKNPTTKYIVDIIDLWPETMPLERLKWVPLIRLWKNMRDKSIKKADFVFLECSWYYKNIFKYLKDKTKVKTLYLFKKDGSCRQSITGINKHQIDKTIMLGYVGSINNIIDIEKISSLIKAIISKGYHVKVRLIGEGESRDKFISSLKLAGAEVCYYGKVFDEKQKAEILSPCDFGINMMKDSVEVGLTIKSLDYFSIGLPIINNIKGDTYRIVEKYNIGVNVSGKETDVEKIISYYLSYSDKVRKKVFAVFDHFFTEKAFLERLEKAFDMIEL